MTEEWKNNTVSMGLVDKEEFDTALAYVSVSENMVRMEQKDVEGWDRIEREMGADGVLEEVRWEDVDTVEKKVDGLYYPHIDIRVHPAPSSRADDLGIKPTKRIYFTEDEVDVLEDVYTAIQRYQNVGKQRSAVEDDRFAAPDEAPEEEVRLEEVLEQDDETAASEGEAADEDSGDSSDPSTSTEDHGEEEEQTAESSGQDSSSRREKLQEARSETESDAEDEDTESEDEEVAEDSDESPTDNASQEGEEADENGGGGDDELDDIVDDYL